MNTDKHRFHIRKKLKDKRPNGTRMNTDKHGFIKKFKAQNPGSDWERMGSLFFFGGAGL
jgi:hypothetical protein